MTRVIASSVVAYMLLASCRMHAPGHSNLVASDLSSDAESSYDLDPQKVSQRWEGWGTSLAWWANVVGTTEYAPQWADLFFTDKEVDFLGKKTPGLDLNIVRYNVGGTGRPGDTLERVENNPLASAEYRDRWYAAIEGFWKNWFDSNPESKSWDWSRDVAQRAILRMAVERGANQVEFFSNSPMWWMKDSKSAAGGRLQPSNRADFAVYLATVVDQAQRRWGIPISSLSPFNEPSAGWWNFPKNQEGANIDAVTREVVIDLLRKEMKRRNLQTAIVGADENNIDQVGDASFYDRLNVHSYVGTDPNRDNNGRRALRNTLGRKKMWSSEFGDSDASGAVLAQTILEDIRHLEPNAWVYWQAVEPTLNPWGLANGIFGLGPNTLNRGKPTTLNNKYYVFAQFTRFIRDDMDILSQKYPMAIVAYSKLRRVIAVVAVNFTNAHQTIAWNLNGLGFKGDATLDTYWTSFDGSVQYKKDQTSISNGFLGLRLNGRSISSISVKIP